MSTAEKVWDERSPDPDAVARLREALGCHRAVARSLVNRGIRDAGTARAFLDPGLDELHPPQALPDLTVAVDRITTALEDSDPITVYGDRDLDGVAGTALLVSLLAELGGTVGYHIPDKYDGYGVHEDAIERLAGRGTELLLTVDCGTRDAAALRAARAAGIDVLVTDHHDPGGATVPAEAWVNPRREDSPYPNDSLAGAGVALQLGLALVDRCLPDLGPDYRDDALPLAGVATVADRAPLTLENRAIVREGYRRLDRCGHPGLVALAEHCDVDSIRGLGWSLAPVLNAAQEDERGDLMLRVLLARDGDRIASLVGRLETYRAARKEQRREWIAELERCIDEQTDPDDAALLVETEGYVGGATAVSETVGKPVLTYYRKGGAYRGCARTAGDIDLLAVIAACEDTLVDAWGHPGAPGFRVEEDDLEAFLTGVRRTIREKYTSEELRPHIEIDDRLDPEELTPELLEQLDRVRPCGNGNSEPQFLLTDIRIDAIELFGDTDRHAALRGAEGAVRLRYWDGGARAAEWSPGRRVDVVGTARWDSFTDAPALDVTSIRASGEAGASTPSV